MKRLLIGALGILLVLVGCSSNRVSDIDAEVHNRVAKYLQEADKEPRKSKDIETILQEAREKSQSVEGDVNKRILKRWGAVADKLYEENPDIDIRLEQYPSYTMEFDDQGNTKAVVDGKTIHIPVGSLLSEYCWDDQGEATYNGTLSITTDSINRSLLRLSFSFGQTTELDGATEEKVIASSSLAMQLASGATPKEAEEILSQFVSSQEVNIVDGGWVYCGQIRPDKDGIMCDVNICKIPD